LTTCFPDKVSFFAHFTGFDSLCKGDRRVENVEAPPPLFDYSFLLRGLETVLLIAFILIFPLRGGYFSKLKTSSYF
jgi:hypothetical protein